MLVPLDNLLRDLLVSEVPALSSAQQVLFQPPDDDLRTAVTNVDDLVLNVYLADLRENRHLRSNRRETVRRNGVVFQQQAPARLECQYLLSAWSPASPSPAVEPTLDEHALLYAATAALVRAAPLAPGRVYPSGAPQLAAWPARFRGEDIPLSVAPPEGYAGVGDFWGAMGQDARWKPTVHVSATIPLELFEEFSGPMVLTRFAHWRAHGSTETLIQIGGFVRNQGAPLPSGDPAPVPAAVVNIETATGVLASTRTDGEGRFRFDHLTPSEPGTPYTLRSHAAGLPVITRPVDVPSPTGEYDLVFP